MNLNLKEKSVLVADDSRLVASSVTTILRNMGIEQIRYAYRPFEILQQCKQDYFDLIICDYNFQSKINGFQILEELQHARCLPATTVFMFLTGENDLKIVRSIIDSEPDDYLLKPYNRTFFINRIITALKRRHVLLPIYQAKFNLDFESVIEECEKLLPFHNEYSKLIRKYRAQALVKNKQFIEAREEYESLLQEDNYDWLKTALANTLIEIDEVEEAKEILDTVTSKDDNPYYHDEMSNMAEKNNDLPSAIEHLKQSTLLLDAGAERDLVITNLSLAMESFDDAIVYIKRYYEKNENTFRGGIFTKLNLIRCYLYRSLHSDSVNSFENLLYGLNPIIAEIQKSSKHSTQARLISAHISLVRGDLKSAITETKKIICGQELDHFYDYFHLCVLLERCSLVNELKSILPFARDSISETQNPSVFRSQIHMVKSLEEKLRLKQKEIDRIRTKIQSTKSTTTSNLSEVIDYYLNLQELLPNSHRVCLAVVKFASIREIKYKGQYNIFRKIDACDKVIQATMPSHELSRINYKSIYSRATDNIIKLK